ncbi:hypothetical protein GCM10023220_13900 [Streptomyces ziwulingensis]|uniref:Uncharacterized protein n=1 Tax=Streptomyces ziwulingensis TaxID=1045501 RepID=A0ABP9B421_9ACTN
MARSYPVADCSRDAGGMARTRNQARQSPSTGTGPVRGAFPSQGVDTATETGCVTTATGAGARGRTPSEVFTRGARP